MRRLNSNDFGKSSIRRRAEQRGRRGELFAAILLRLSLHKILAQRLRTPVGEVDIIALRGDQLVFIEVKTRLRRGQLADALISINQRRITAAAKHFLAQNPQYAHFNMRFDVIFLASNSLPIHIKNAFSSN